MMMKVAIIGSRSYTNSRKIKDFVYQLKEKYKEELEIVEINTPGKLDIDIIMNMMHDNPQVDIPDFIKYIYKHRSDDLYNNFPHFPYPTRQILSILF